MIVGKTWQPQERIDSDRPNTALPETPSQWQAERDAGELGRLPVRRSGSHRREPQASAPTGGQSHQLPVAADANHLGPNIAQPSAAQPPEIPSWSIPGAFPTSLAASMPRPNAPRPGADNQVSGNAAGIRDMRNQAPESRTVEAPRAAPTFASRALTVVAQAGELLVACLRGTLHWAYAALQGLTSQGSVVAPPAAQPTQPTVAEPRPERPLDPLNKYQLREAELRLSYVKQMEPGRRQMELARIDDYLRTKGFQPASRYMSPEGKLSKDAKTIKRGGDDMAARLRGAFHKAAKRINTAPQGAKPHQTRLFEDYHSFEDIDQTLMAQRLPQDLTRARRQVEPPPGL